MMAPWRPDCDEKEGGVPRPITKRAAGPAEAEAIWRLTVEAYLPDRERLHPPSGVFRETVPDVQRAMDEGTVDVAQCGAALVGAVRVQPARDQDASGVCNAPLLRIPGGAAGCAPAGHRHGADGARGAARL
jgi:hypothetical protein